MEAGYSLPRQQFDWLLFHGATELVLENGGSVIQGAMNRVFDEDGKITGLNWVVVSVVACILCSWTIGAGGYQCLLARKVAKEMAKEEVVDRIHCGGYREYWSGVRGCEGNAGNIEIHFVDGWHWLFWLFPWWRRRVNVGIGMDGAFG